MNVTQSNKLDHPTGWSAFDQLTDQRAMPHATHNRASNSFPFIIFATTLYAIVAHTHIMARVDEWLRCCRRHSFCALQHCTSTGLVDMTPMAVAIFIFSLYYKLT